MKVNELLAKINDSFPFELCAEWDNSGLLVGSYESEVKKIAVCLDAVPEAVIKAHELGCNVLVSHHPLIFRGIKQIDVNNWLGRSIKEALSREINIIAVHTNFDRAENGMNYEIAKKIGLVNCEDLAEYGVKGLLQEKMSLSNFLTHVKTCLNLTHLDCYGQEKEISRAALCGGSGGEFWEAARDSDCDIYITCDMKYHEIIDSSRGGIITALCDHGEMERAGLSALAGKLNAEIIDVHALNNYRRI